MCPKYILNVPASALTLQNYCVVLGSTFTFKNAAQKPLQFDSFTLAAGYFSFQSTCHDLLRKSCKPRDCSRKLGRRNNEVAHSRQKIHRSARNLDCFRLWRYQHWYMLVLLCLDTTEIRLPDKSRTGLRQQCPNCIY